MSLFFRSCKGWIRQPKIRQYVVKFTGNRGISCFKFAGNRFSLIYGVVKHKNIRFMALDGIKISDLWRWNYFFAIFAMLNDVIYGG